jgi:hypothetical protein
MLCTVAKAPKNPYDIVLRIIHGGTRSEAEYDAQVSGISEGGINMFIAR